MNTLHIYINHQLRRKFIYWPDQAKTIADELVRVWPELILGGTVGVVAIGGDGVPHIVCRS